MTTTDVPTIEPITSSTARFFQVLADPTRVRVLELLLSGERNVGELVEALGLHHPTQTDAWARAADVVQRERRAYDEASRAAQAQVDAYYASGAFRRAGLFILLGVVLYLLVVGFVVFDRKP